MPIGFRGTVRDRRQFGPDSNFELGPDDRESGPGSGGGPFTPPGGGPSTPPGGDVTGGPAQGPEEIGGGIHEIFPGGSLGPPPGAGGGGGAHGGPPANEPPIELPPGDMSGAGVGMPPPPPPNTSVEGTFASPANPASLSVFRTPEFGTNRSTGGPTSFGPGSSPLTGDAGVNTYEELLRKLRGER